MPLDHFTITDDHVKLARRLKFQHEHGIEWGGPAVDFKRPFGNGDLYGDMRNILGRDHVVINDEEPDLEELTKLYSELGTVVAIALRTGKLEAGEYVTPRYFSQWVAA